MARTALFDRAYLGQGITFAHGGREQPFPFDLLPRLIPAGEWAQLEAGLSQRVRALDRFIADVYGERRAGADGVVPNRLVATCEGYARAMVGVEPPLGRFVQVAGIDLVRGDDGVWRVLEDNLRCPSGLSYVVQNRAFMRRASRRPSATTTWSRSAPRPSCCYRPGEPSERLAESRRAGRRTLAGGCTCPASSGLGRATPGSRRRSPGWGGRARPHPTPARRTRTTCGWRSAAITRTCRRCGAATSARRRRR